MGFLFFKAATVTTETVFSSQRTNYEYVKPNEEMKHILELVARGDVTRLPISPQLLEKNLDWKECLVEGGVLDQLSSGHTQGKLVMKIT